MSELAFDPLEIAEAEERPIANSHLFRGRCACGAVALHAAGQRARCGGCRRQDAGAVNVTGGRLWPVVSFVPAQTVPKALDVRDPYPAPEWTSRDAQGHAEAAGAPAVVLSLAGRARGAGWEARVQCSRGRRPHGSTGRPLAVKTLYAVVMAHAEMGANAYAVHDGGAWSSVMVWGRSFPFFPLASVTDLHGFIDARGEVGADWFDAIRQRVGESEARTKARAACNRGVHPLAEVVDGAAWCPTCLNSWAASGDPWRRPKVGKSEAN